MKIGLTGSSGVLASSLLKILNKNNLKYFKGRIENTKDVYNWINANSFEYIIHLAALVPTNLVNKDRNKALHVNFKGTKNIVDAINKNSKKKIWFFYSSTSHVYEFNSKIIKETNHTKPISYYGKTKLLGERYLLENTKKITPCIGRIFSYTSKKQKNSFIIPSIFKKLKHKNKKLYINNMNHERDFLPIEDICKAIKILLKKKSNGIFNICSGKRLNLQDIFLKLNDKRYQKEVIINQNKNKTILYGSNKKLLKLGWKQKNINYVNYLLNNY